jgi:eukaryotic-like serine/threonine-protein kinase
MQPLGIPLGRYLLGERLAIGGMGEVYLAVQTGMGRFQKPLALKLLLPHLADSPRAVQMFLDEAHLAARMNHPNVAQIFDVGVENGRYFMAMELVRGVSLSKLIQALKNDRRRVSPAVAAYVARALCDGLHHAHEQVDPDGIPLNLVHRDVNPQNVLVSVDGAVKLTDFGIARAETTAGHTTPGTIMGKFAYLAPEQANAMPLDRRVDIFAAGVTLFHLATLHSPFEREHEASTLLAICRDELPDLRVFRPDLAESFLAAIHRATQKDPTKRFATAREFRDALDSSPEGGADELGQWVRELCQPDVAFISEKTVQILALREGTEPLPEDLPSAPPRVAQVSNRGGRALAAVVGVALTAVLLVAIAALRRSTPLAPAEFGPAQTESLPAAASEIRPEPALVRATEPIAAPSRSTSTRTPVAKSFGYLTVDATPWAKVSIGGRYIDDTPIAAFPVESGLVSVSLHNPETGKTVRRQVKVVSGRTAFLKVDLQ